MTGLTFGIGDKLFDRDLLLSWKYAAKISTRLVKDVLGPFGVVFLVAGVWSAWQRRKVAEIAGICAFISYLVVVTGGNFHHNYYQLPVVPIATVLISLGILDGGRRLAARYRNATPMYAVCSIMVASMVLTTFARSVSFHSWYEIDPEIVYLCNETRMDLQPTERVVIVGSKSPALLFCLDRKGWLLDPEEARPSRLAEVKQQGARTIIVQHLTEEIRLFLDQHGRLSHRTGSWSVYRLASPTLSDVPGRREN